MDNQATVLFADISGSTRLYETLGDEAALVLISDCLQLLQQVGKKYQGRVVKTIGDEIMLRFPKPVLAAQAAFEMLDQATQFFHKRQVISGLKVGFNHGPVLEQADGDLFGDAVNVAARMVQLAKRNQILVPAATLQQIEPSLSLQKRLVDRTLVRGKSGPIEVYEIVAHPSDATIVGTSAVPLPPTPTVTRLRLQFQNQVYYLDEQHPTLSLGRAPDNDLVIRCDQVSRQHGRIEWRRGKFVLVDQSANGTYIYPLGQAPLHIRRDEYVLTDAGTIHPGSPQVESIQYQCLVGPAVYA
ncbi:MAG: adenylate/guanylate cyclase domain-containing protein [Gloeomargarita sp. SKYBB_i_bin120]|nr:adenylate/guanylate cyclase domain-containing protein [Gloeomargarita sp. SKYG98]MCS7291989.1 adenylate/guanylate cyclase domain-containing protein [Gloeomargarita sp. SKYB120]MDW8177549.1 adenylate/guanylate cyclase domain-containing protein [Gloeomargarita sp. SKYBB_i_bin120]